MGKKGNWSLITFEKTLEAKIDGLILSGRIDRIDKVDDNGFEVVGYKSGKFMEGEEQDLQLTLYYVLLQNSYLYIIPKKFTYHYLKSNQKLTFGKSEAEIKEGWSRAKGMVQEIRSTRQFKPNSNKFCNWCDFKEICTKDKNDKVKESRELKPILYLRMDSENELFKELCL